MRTLALLLLVFAANAPAQDAERGQRLFNQTAAVTGKPVANCTSCHADTQTLRSMLANRGVAAGDARAIRLLLQASISGAIPGARNAKAQYQNVLSAADLEDLAAYLARVQSAAAASPLARN
jgi:cytochrome c553